jgi:hypothetical protein
MSAQYRGLEEEAGLFWYRNPDQLALLCIDASVDQFCNQIKEFKSYFVF